MLKYNFCPKCGSKDIHQKGGIVKCSNCKYTVYLHSAATASILPIKDDKVLLTHRKFEPQKEKIDFLGGFLNYGEDPKNGAKREMKEETGCEIEILNLIGVYMDSYYYQNEDVITLNFVYVAKIIKGNMQIADDVADVFWQPLSKLPKDVAYKTIKNALKDLQKWYKKNENN
jgi:ADP-ribose pyrophosphatase YjhB (NUDIX family)